MLQLLVNCSQTQPDGSFTGFQNQTSGIIRFQGVRFADAPIGNLRWRAAPHHQALILEMWTRSSLQMLSYQQSKL